MQNDKLLIYLAGSEKKSFKELFDNYDFLYNHLVSYYYISKSKGNLFYNYLKNKTLNILVDSGAHTFHTSKNINWVDYTEGYGRWINLTDSENVVGYFEMDIDNRIGHKKVKLLRKILEDYSDKIIPVWHKNRGIKEWVRLSHNYDYISFSCLPIENLSTEDMVKMVDIAHDNGCKVHGLGGTNKRIYGVGVDSVDSASWIYGIWGRFGNKFVNNTISTEKLHYMNYNLWRERQKRYGGF